MVTAPFLYFGNFSDSLSSENAYGRKHESCINHC